VYAAFPRPESYGGSVTLGSATLGNLTVGGNTVSGSDGYGAGAVRVNEPVTYVNNAYIDDDLRARLSIGAFQVGDISVTDNVVNAGLFDGVVEGVFVPGGRVDVSSPVQYVNYLSSGWSTSGNTGLTTVGPATVGRITVSGNRGARNDPSVPLGYLNACCPANYLSYAELGSGPDAGGSYQTGAVAVGAIAVKDNVADELDFSYPANYLAGGYMYTGNAGALTLGPVSVASITAATR
jgi:hypothetical protein